MHACNAPRGVGARSWPTRPGIRAAGLYNVAGVVVVASMAGPMWTTRSRAAQLVALATGLMALCSAAPASAGDDEDLAALLDEHVVSGASKTSELAKDAPATTSVITSEDITRYGIRTLAEAINFLGMGLITQDPLHSVESGGRGVLITSDFGSHMLLVVDGHVFNEAWGGTPYFEQGLGIPLEMIDHIELILGPGSVLYGGNAMIGVINVVTKRAAANRGLHLTLGGGVSPQQGKNGDFTSFAPADLGGYSRIGVGLGRELPFGERAEINVGAEVYYQNGPTFEWGPQIVTKEDGSPYNFGPRTPPGVWGGRVEDQYNTLVPTLYSRVQIGDLAVMFRAEMYRRATPVQGFDQQSTDFDEERSWERDRWVSIDVQYNKRIARKLSLSLRGYADAYDYYQQTYNTESSVCEVAPDGPCLFQGKGRSRWLGSEVQASYDWTEEDRYTTLLGLNGTVRGVGGETVSVAANTGQVLDVAGRNDVTEVVKAAYIQQRIAPTGFLHLNVGARYDADPRGGKRLSPRAAVAVDVWGGGVLKLIYAEAFRPPTYFEALYTSPYQIPNSSIRSEYVRGVEATFEQRVGRNNFLLGVFRTRWSDMLSIQTLDSGVSQYQNLTSIENYGINASVQGGLDSFRYGASIVGAHTRAVTPDGEQPLPAAPQFFGNARVSYSLPDSLPTIALATSFVGRRPADRLLDGNFLPPPYAPASAEFRLTLSQQLASLPGLSYRVGGSYTTGNVVPYVAGPIQYYEATAEDRGPAELTQVVKLVGFATLRYDFSL
jgi:outer membrane receptor for ferrienterochelin and colicins